MTDDDTPQHTGAAAPDHIAPDTPAPEPEHAGPAEVVDEVRPGVRPPRPVGRLVRIGSVVLALVGALMVLFGGISVSSPEAGVCRTAELELEDADDPTLDPDDVDCDSDEGRAEAIAAAEEANGDDDLPDETYFQRTGSIGIGIGLVQLAGGILTMRTRSRRARLLAGVGAALGILVSFVSVGLLGLLLLGFVVYALFFSGDSRAVFGDPGGPRMFRPRT